MLNIRLSGVEENRNITEKIHGYSEGHERQLFDTGASQGWERRRHMIHCGDHLK